MCYRQEKPTDRTGRLTPDPLGLSYFFSIKPMPQDLTEWWWHTQQQLMQPVLDTDSSWPQLPTGTQSCLPGPASSGPALGEPRQHILTWPLLRFDDFIFFHLKQCLQTLGKHFVNTRATNY